MNVAHSNVFPDDGRANSDGSSGFRQRSAPYLPDGYRLLAPREGGGLLLLREDGSEVGYFEPHELERAERAAFEDARECRRRRRNNPPSL